MPRLVVLVVGSSVHRDLSWSSVLASVADQLARALPPAMVQTTFIACLARLAPLSHFRGCMSSTFVCLGTVANCAFPQIGTIRRHLRFQYVVWVGFHEIYLLIVHVVVLSGFFYLRAVEHALVAIGFLVIGSASYALSRWSVELVASDALLCYFVV